MINIEDLIKQHESVFNEVNTRNQYRICYTDFKEKNVIDIGANNGIFTLLAHDFSAKNIIAIESNPAAFKLLESNTKSCKNVTVMNRAVYSESGKKVNIGKESYFGEIDGRCYINASDSGNIETIALNDIISSMDENEIVLKLDCEGSEYEILYAMKRAHFSRLSTILIETHENIRNIEKGEAKKLISYIQSFGFQVIFQENVSGEDVKIFRLNRINKDESVTILINGFLRPEYISPLVDALKSQTIQPDKIIVFYSKPTKETVVPYIDGIDFIVAEQDQGLPARFATGLVAKTKYLCIMDDDLLPGNRWLETCLRLIQKENSIVCGYGMRYLENMNDLNAKRFGDHGEHNEEPEIVDVGGHCFFMRKEWLKYFWMEEPIDWTVSDDIHFSYTMKKFGNLDILVSPHPVSDSSVWCNTQPERGIGKKSLHARGKDKNPHTNNWNQDDIVTLQGNLHIFIDKRQKIMDKYLQLGWKS